MTGLSINGLGVVGGYGCGTETFRSALVSGSPLIPKTGNGSGEGDNKIPVLLADHQPLERYLSRRATRRIDHFSCLALLGAFLALEDAGLAEKDLHNAGLILVSGYGATQTTFAFLDSYMDKDETFASPTLFSNSVHNAATAHVAIQLGIKGPSLTVSQFELSVASGLIAASRWIREGRVDAVLFGAVDEFCPVLGYCWEEMVPEREGKSIIPFDIKTQTAIPGEGSVFFLLTGNKDDARYGIIEDVGINCFPSLPIEESDSILFTLGADGHPGCSSHYLNILSTDASVCAFTPLYGSLPVGQAFDLAAAGLMARGRSVFPTLGPSRGASWVIAQNGPLKAATTCCIKAGMDSSYGMIKVRNMSVAQQTGNG